MRAEPTPPSYELVDDLCERLDHQWMTDLAGTSPRFRYIPSLPEGQDHRRCFATVFSKEQRTLIQVQIDTSTPADGQATLPGSAQPVAGLGDQAQIQHGQPVTGPNEHLGGQITTRIDRIAAVHSTAKVWVTVTIHAPTAPDEPATRSAMTAYVNQAFTFMTVGR
ncbi:hypothetical protein [Verrucosispora sp. TAA-831]|uniref:hypothetical protein n=1 Tax=Verrucosispora sp. TAA-831 TaxID=3422227 RepID=UPI003D6F290F